MPRFSQRRVTMALAVLAIAAAGAVPAFLIYSALSDGTIDREQKLSSLEGGITGIENGDFFGRAPASIGDLDDDGVGDLVIGASGDDDGGTNFGAVYILFMNADGTVRDQQKISATSGNFTGPLDGADDFGASSTAALGDLDGDGVEDIAVGERANDDSGTDRGAVYILFLNSDGTVKDEQKISGTSGGFSGALSNDDSFGDCLVPIADVNNDAVRDLIVCARNDDDAGSDHGTLWVLYLNQDGTVSGHHKINETTGGFGGDLDDVDRFGVSASAIGDLDNDGVIDLAVGAILDDDGGSTTTANRGAVWILFMNANGTVKDETKISTLSQNFTGTLDDGDNFGSAIADVGDLDGNGTNDIVVGAPQDDDGGLNLGAAYLLFLDSNGTIVRYQKISETSGSGFSGQLDANDNFGGHLAAVDDLDGDGLKEILLTAHQDDDGGLNRGASWLLFFNVNRSSQDAPVFPFNTAFSINEGAICTTSRNVTLSIEARDAADIVVSNNHTFVDSFWQPFIEPSPMTSSWTLPGDDGSHTVYMMFRGPTGNTSNVHEQMITLDQENNCGQPEAQGEEQEARYGPSPVTGLEELINPVEPGDYIRGKSFSTVYYINDAMERMPFYDVQTFCTWQESFDIVKTVTDATLASLPVNGPVFPKPEVVLVKIDSAQGVYAVIGDDRYPRHVTLRKISSEGLARLLYGEDWDDYIIDVPVTLFHHFAVGSPIRIQYDLTVDQTLMKKRESLCQNLD